MRRLKTLAVAALSAATLIGCQSAANTNVNVNKALNSNSNVAVVVNNNSNTAVMNSNMSGTMNSNVSRTDYDKDRTKYEANKGTSTIGQGANDSWLWFKTKTALAAANDLRDSTINVDVSNDIVTLKGTVATKAQSDKAASVAKGIEGVKSVTNSLKVQPNDSMTNQMVNGNSKMTNANMKK